MSGDRDYTDFLGITSIRDGAQVWGHLPFDPALVGNATVKALHGGTLAALLGATAVLQAAESLDLATEPRVVSLTTEFLRPAAYTDTYAEASFTRLGGRVANARVVAWQAERSEPVAVANVILTLERRSHEAL